MTIFKPISKVWVITSKYAYMQTIQDLARLEYFWYSQGEFPIEKFLKVYESLIRKYPLFSDKNSVFRARKAGKIVGRLMFWRVNEKTIHFTMMFQGSEEQILALYRSNGSEIPQNVNNKFSRLEITTYELCKHMRSSRDKNGEKSINSIPSWTWQYKAGDLQSLRDRLLDSIGRNHNEEVYRVIANLAYAPGFAGVRAQVIETHAIAKRCWANKYGVKSILKIPPVLYLRRIKQKGLFLTQEILLKERRIRQESALCKLSRENEEEVQMYKLITSMIYSEDV